MTLVIEIIIGQFITVFMISEAATPMPMPMEPPRRLIKMDSMRNCKRMSRPRAPMAMRSPISLVRSVTETYMMFMIPIPPTNKLIPAMAVRTSESMSEVLVTV